MTNWWKDNWWKVLIVLFGPMVFLDLTMDLPFVNSWSKADDSAWLGFWGGYLGSVIAVGGVYWQVSREKEENIKAARPVFALMYDDGFERKLNGSLRSYVSDEDFIGYVTDIYNHRDPLGRQSERGYLLLINNPSANPLLFVEITLFYKNKIGDSDTEKLFISRIEAGSKVQCIPRQYIYSHLGIKPKTNFGENENILAASPLIMKVVIKLTTIRNEKLIYTYKKEDKLAMLKRISAEREDYNIEQFEDSHNIILDDK